MKRINPRELKVRVGDLVIPAWNRLVEFGKSLTIYSGPGILISPRIGGGVTVSARPFVASFTHPWRVSMAGSEAEIEPGLVNGMEPLIDGVPMSGKNNGPRPKLKLSENKFDKTGRSWISIEVTVDPKTGKILPKPGLRIIQTEIYLGQDGGTLEVRPGVALEPIAMFKRADDAAGFGKLLQVRFFHVTAHRVNLTNPGGPRHFFP